MKKTIYISFDFGMKGDFEGLYRWLDEHNAEERGYGLAIIKQFEFPEKYISKSQEKNTTDLIFITQLKKDIEKYVEIGKSDRIYVIWRSFDTNKIKGGFIFGKKKQPPWIGFSQKESDEFDIGI